MVPEGIAKRCHLRTPFARTEALSVIVLLNVILCLLGSEERFMYF